MIRRMRGAAFVLFVVLNSSLPSAGQHLPYEMVVNVDHHGLAHQGTFDLHPDGPITYVWNTYRASHERIYSTRFENARRAHAQELTAGAGIYYRPLFAATGARSGWVFWQAERNGLWVIIGRRLDEGFWQPIETISPAGQNSLFPSATAHDGGVAVAWEDHSSVPQRIQVRTWDGRRWQASATVSGRGNRPTGQPWPLPMTVSCGRFGTATKDGTTPSTGGGLLPITVRSSVSRLPARAASNRLPSTARIPV